jgi:RNase P/RNase MRP subunit p29
MNPYLTDVIGANLKILEHSDPSLVNVTGTVVDESKNTLLIDTGNGRKVIPKSRSKVTLDGFKVDLYEIRIRPEDKIKKMRRRRA